MMYQQLDEDAVAIRDLVRDFARREVAPAAAGWDAAEAVPEEPMRALGELGILGVALAEEAGGTGLGPLELAVVCEELGAASGVLGHRVAGLAGTLRLFAEVAPANPVLAGAVAGTTPLVGGPAFGLVGTSGNRWSGEIAPAYRAMTSDRVLALVHGGAAGDQVVLFDLSKAVSKGRVRREKRDGVLGLRGVDLGVLGLAEVRALALGAAPAGAA
ncbi:MAG: hypothetical protein EP329_16215, partial [Deltaproteobacteria bacterium]